MILSVPRGTENMKKHNLKKMASSDRGCAVFLNEEVLDSDAEPVERLFPDSLTHYSARFVNEYNTRQQRDKHCLASGRVRRFVIGVRLDSWLLTGLREEKIMITMSMYLVHCFPETLTQFCFSVKHIRSQTKTPDVSERKTFPEAPGLAALAARRLLDALRGRLPSVPHEATVIPVCLFMQHRQNKGRSKTDFTRKNLVKLRFMKLAGSRAFGETPLKAAFKLQVMLKNRNCDFRSPTANSSELFTYLDEALS